MSKRRSAGRCASPMTPIALCCRRRRTGRRPGAALCSGSSSAPGSAAASSSTAASWATLERYAERLARALAGVINILDPDAIVLGGGLSSLRHLYEDVPRHWVGHIISDTIATRLLPPVHGDSSGVRGAAWLWRPEDLV